MELFTQEAVDKGLANGEINVIPSSWILKTLKGKNIEEWSKKGIKYIAISRKQIRKNKKLLMELKKHKIKVYAFHVNFTHYADEDYMTKYEMYFIHGIYADEWNFKTQEKNP